MPCNPDCKQLNELLAVTTRRAAAKQSAATAAPADATADKQILPSSSSSLPAGTADQPAGGIPASAPVKRKHIASPPATGVITLSIGKGKHNQPSADFSSSPDDLYSSSVEPVLVQESDAVLPEPALDDDMTEASAIDPLALADENRTAGMPFNDQWWQGDRILVPHSPPKRLILQNMHDHPMVARLAVHNTIAPAASTGLVPTGRCATILSIAQVVRLQLAHPAKPSGLLQPLDVRLWLLHTVTTDHMAALLLTPNGNNAIAAFVCKNTKYVHEWFCSDKSDAHDWARVYVEHVVQHEDTAHVIISHCGARFSGNFNQALKFVRGSC